MPDHTNSSDEARLYRYVVINHRTRQFLYVLVMSKIDALLFDERQLINKSNCLCYLESDAIKHFSSTAPLEFKRPA